MTATSLEHGSSLPANILDKLLRAPKLVRRIGRTALDSITRLRKVSQLEFSGAHALDIARPHGKTVFELGAAAVNPLLYNP